MFESSLFGKIQIGQVVNRDQIKCAEHEDAKKIFHALQYYRILNLAVPLIHRRLDHMEYRQSPGEGHD